MARYLNTLGNVPLSVFVCPRCHMKRPYTEMVVDPNTKLRVCSHDCADLYDPYRLPPRKDEDISLQYPRPDTDLTPPE